MYEKEELHLDKGLKVDPNTEPADPVGLLVSNTGPSQTAGASDVLATAVFPNAKMIHRVYCGQAGNIAIKRANDTAFVVYPVLKGAYLDGRIIAVGGTGSGTDSGFVWIPEV